MSKTPRQQLELEEIRRILRAHLSELREHHGVKTLGIFGSRVHGQMRAGSDVDLLVELDDRPITLFEFINLEQHLSELLGAKVDLVEKTALRADIGAQILRDVVPCEEG